MRKNFRQKSLGALLPLLLCSGASFAQFKVVGYMPSWAGSVSAVQYSKLTHINYAFLLPNSDGSLQAIDNASKLQSLVSTAHANGVKVQISVGGWNNGDDSQFETLAANSGSRTAFVNNLVGFVSQYGLDGVDIDWEYPDNGASANNYLALMQQLATQMHSRGKLLTAAVVAYGGASILNGVFDAADFLNIMAYDENNYQHSTYALAVQAVNYWRGRGLPAAKTVLGVPFYGHPTWESYAALLARGADPYSDTFDGVGYNGITTIKNKTNLAFDQGGGVMMWELSQDATGTYSLLSAMHDVVVSRGGGGNTGVIEAESYGNMSGIQTEACTDAGGGLNVGYIDAGDWMAYYNINFPQTGAYKVEYRVASLNGGGVLSLDLNAGSIVLGQASIPATGGWQNWTTVSNTVTITAGTYNLGVYAVTGGWNLNWVKITYLGASAKTAAEQAAPAATHPALNKAAGAIIYPSPVHDNLHILAGEELANGLVSVYDISGKLVMGVQRLTGNVDVSRLRPGVYMLTITNHKTIFTQRFIKQ